MSEAIVRVVAAVITRESDLLICQRAPGKRHGGLWEFPGGKCESGESDEAAIRRELREELGVDVLCVGQLDCAVHDPGSPYLIVFTPVTIVGEPTCREHIALRWSPLADLLGLPLAPSDRRYIEYRLAHRV